MSKQTSHPGTAQGAGYMRLYLLSVVAQPHYWHPILDWQHRLSTLLRQLHFKGIEEEGRLGVVAHQRRQFR